MNRCGHCEIGHEEYRAVGNKPTHAHLCGSCFLRLDDDEAADYARVGAPDTQRFARGSVLDMGALADALLKNPIRSDLAVLRAAELRAAGHQDVNLRVIWAPVGGSDPARKKSLFRYEVRRGDGYIDAVRGHWRDPATLQPVQTSSTEPSPAEASVTLDGQHARQITDGIAIRDQGAHELIFKVLPGPRELETIAGSGWRAVRFTPSDGPEAVWGRFSGHPSAVGGTCFAAALAGKGGVHTIDIDPKAVRREIERCNREGTVAQIYGEAVRSHIIRRVKGWPS